MGVLDTMLATALGVAVGTGQTYGLRELVDKKYPDKRITQLKGFGTPSVLAGISVGGVATGYTVSRAVTKRSLKDEEHFAFGYGISAIVTAIVSGLSPVEAEATTAAGLGAGGVRKLILSGGRQVQPPAPTQQYLGAPQRGLV